MSTKRKADSNILHDQNTYKVLKTQEKPKEGHVDDQNSTVVVNPTPSHLPDLVICRILRFLPMKSAICTGLVSKQWETVLWPSGLPLDFDEEEFNREEVRSKFRHEKFVNLVESCLKTREKDGNDILDKFKLRMILYDEDTARVDKWLSFALERSVKELDISLQRKESAAIQLYSLFDTILNARSITKLYLESVRIKNNFISLPSLKSLSLKSVAFDKRALSSLILGCPSIENLSLVSCFFNLNRSPFNLERHPEIGNIQIQATKLEFFTWESNSDTFLRSMTFHRCRRLKYITIDSDSLEHLDLCGCHDSLKAKISTPNLTSFSFNGKLECQFVLDAPKLEEATIALRDRKPALIDDSWKHFSTLRDFLSQNFGRYWGLLLIVYVFDVEGFIFPEEFRMTCSAPLPRTKVQVRLTSATTESIRLALMESLRWMAPARDFYFPHPFQIQTK